MARDLVQTNVTLSAEVREAAARAATEGAMSLNDLYVGALADRFRVRFDATGRRSRGAQRNGAATVNLHMPARLLEKIVVESVRQRCSQSSVVEGVMRTHFRLDAVAA